MERSWNMAINKKNYNIDAIESRVKMILSGKVRDSMVCPIGYKLEYGSKEAAEKMCGRLKEREINCEMKSISPNYAQLIFIDIKNNLLKK